ncbi:hypothetical protein Bca101_061271 [Brassica carinata]
MLKRKTVTEKSTRLKLASLAILSSVLLSTNLKMKMLKEYSNHLGDIDEFFAFPWGCLAFEMLMCSIKKRDVVSLSKNTIALQGFAMALQLVIVEAVPSLTEVVQEACSSSDSDSDDEDPDCLRNKAKKQTLSPAHARDIDKKSEVFVRSIIPQDPHRPVDESLLVWPDESEDLKVENMLKLIASDYVFSSIMFKGGVTKMEVAKMREDAQKALKRKPTRAKKITPSSVDDEQLRSLLHQQFLPSMRFPTLLLPMKHLAMFKTLKEEVLAAATSTKFQSDPNVEAPVPPYEQPQHKIPSPSRSCRRGGALSANCNPRTVEDNDNIINNVLDNLSEYSTPPSPAGRSPVLEIETNGKRSHVLSTGHSEGNSHQHASVSANSHAYPELDLGGPSFSLGLTQDLKAPPTAAEDVVAENDNCQGQDDNEKTVGFRKSKRLRTVPQSLVTDYQLGNAILTRAWEGQMCSESHYDSSLVREKYAKLRTLLRERCVINVGGLAVTGKDLSNIAEQNRYLPAKIVDIIMKLVRSTFIRNFVRTVEINTEFLDTRFCGSSANVNRFYIPFNVDRKHWIGVCVDCTALKIFVLDCNSALRSDAALLKELRPISEMFLFLLKFAGMLHGVEPASLLVERVKGIAQNTNPADAGLTAGLLMQTHALFGPDTCRCITPSVIPEEAQRAAVMLYEFYQQL